MSTFSVNASGELVNVFCVGSIRKVVVTKGKESTQEPFAKIPRQR